MIVYRAQQRAIRTSGVQLPHDPLDRLIELGELEAGVADALSPAGDADHPLLAALREAIIDPSGVLPAGLPEEIAVSVPEGYAHYGVYPAAYAEAAAQFFADCRPAVAVVVGIRSIGTSLSAAVARELRQRGCEVHAWTVRPRGHPFDRRLDLAPSLERRWSELGHAHFLVVDEGPGLSGSSFACVAGRLSAMGIPDDRIVLFPGWNPDGATFVNEGARRRWACHRKYVGSARVPQGFEEDVDWSAGAWRAVVFQNDALYPAVHPQHERRKYLRRGALLLKFAGLGRYGRAALERARRLAEAGFTPPALGLEDGFMTLRYLPGRPLAPVDAGPELFETMAGYLACLRREFALDRPAPLPELFEMARHNITEALGEEWAVRLDRIPRVESVAVALDGRMLPHEWIRTPEGFVKTDAVEHHDDHFYPGPQDIAWDLAAAGCEFELGAGAIECLVARYESLSGDRGLHRRLPFHRAAWLAFRLGYTTMASQALGPTPDGVRFERLRRRYTALLGRELAAYD